MENITIIWFASDGYGGKDRPQYVDINGGELAECETEEEVNSLIQDVVQADFEDKVGPEWGDSQEAKVIAAWKAAKSAEAEKESGGGD